MQKPLEIMRIVRIPPLGKLVVDLGGQQYQSADQMPDARQRQMVLAALGELISFAGGYDTLVKAGYAPPLVPPAPTAAREDAPLTPAQAAFLASLRDGVIEVDTAAPPPIVRPTLSKEEQEAAFLEQMRRGVVPTAVLVEKPSPPAAVVPPTPPTAVPAPPPSPADDPLSQLNAILQRHLAQIPSLKGQEIILEQHKDGVRLNVNGTRYAKPSEVPDPLIQQTVKNARQELAEKLR